MKTYHLISNPVAGKNKKGKALQKLIEIFDARGVKYDTHFSSCKRDVTQIVNDLTKAGEKEIIALGGDGTLHEALNGIADPTQCRLGLIPAGTGNDFAEKIGLSTDVEAAAEVVLSGKTQATDYLEVGGVRCMNVAGLGMDVEVLERCQKGKSKGKMKYLKSLIQSLFAFKGYRLEIESEGRKEEHDALIAAACNGGFFGGGIQICPKADVADGKMDAVIVDCVGGKWKIIKTFISLMKNKILELPITTHFLCERLRVVPAMACTVQLDGELYKDLEFDVKLCKGLQFYRP